MTEERKKEIKKLTSDLLYDRYKYQDKEFYAWKKCVEIYYDLNEFCIEFFFEYKRYLFQGNKTDSDVVFYKFCRDVDQEKFIPYAESYSYHLHTSISQFIYSWEGMLWSVFEYYEDEKALPEEEYAPKFLEIILDRLNELRKSSDK